MTEEAENGDQMLTAKGRPNIRSQPFSSRQHKDIKDFSSHCAALEMKAVAALCRTDRRWEKLEAGKLHRGCAGAPGLSQLPWE